MTSHHQNSLSVMPVAVSDRPVDYILADLRSRNEETRRKAAADLGHYLYESSRSLSAEAYNKAYQELYSKCFALVASSDLQDKYAGVLAIEQIVEVLGNDMSRASRLGAVIQRALPCPDPQVMTLAAKVLAKLAAHGGNFMAGHVSVQVKSCIEWLQAVGTGDRVEQRRYAAVLVIRELAKEAPGLIYDSVPDLLDNLWTALRDQKVAIREAAASALNGCILITNMRDPATRDEALNLVYEQTQKGLKMSSPEAIHGSLLGLNELFCDGERFMTKHFQHVLDQILQFKDHRDTLVRQAVIELLSTLANYDTENFKESLHRVMIYLFGLLKNGKDRTTIFHAIGHIAVAVKGSLNTYLNSIVDSIKEGYNSRGKKGAATDESLYLCITRVALSLGPVFTKYMQVLFDLMFGAGLSVSLWTSLNDIGHGLPGVGPGIPQLIPEIQERLLDLLSLILAGRPFAQIGGPGILKTTAPSQISIHSPISMSNGYSNGSSYSIPTARTDAVIELALTVLGEFDFTGIFSSQTKKTPVSEESVPYEFSLGEFIRLDVIKYLESDKPEIRRNAALACCKVLAVDPVTSQESTYSTRLVTEVLDKLLTVAVADPEYTIRHTTLVHLDPAFDRFLGQRDSVKSLFLALNDEVFNVRDAAIAVIGRLAILNPAHVMPGLRKVLLQFLTELEYSSSVKNREEAATLLCRLVSGSHRLTKPYVNAMFNVLLPKARDPNPSVAAAITNTFAELCYVGDEDVTPHRDELMSLILENLQDQASNTKRIAGLQALGNLGTYSGYVIDPYLEHPTLMGTLLSMIKQEPVLHIRREVVKTLGILGALDPYKHNVNLMAAEGISNDAYVESYSSGDNAHPSNIGPNHDEYFPTVAFNSLVDIIMDPSQSDYHTAAVDAVMYIFRSLRLKVVVFLGQVLPAFLTVTRTCPVGLQEYYFQNLGQLISIVKQYVRNYLPPIIATIKDFWTSTNNPGLQTIIVDVIQAISLALDAEFKGYLPQILPLLLQAFDGNLKEARTRSLLSKVLHAFAVFGPSLEEYLHLAIPSIVHTFEPSDIHSSLRKQALVTISQICHKVNFSDFASRIVHPIGRILAIPSTPDDVIVAAMDALCSLLVQMGRDFVPFIPVISKHLVLRKINHHAFDNLVSDLLKGVKIPNDLVFGEPVILANNDPVVAADAGAKLLVNQVHLKAAWTLIDRPKADDWREWIHRLSVSLLKESPSLSLRACANLAEVNVVVAQDMFNVGFVSCWSELYQQYQEELVKTIATALAATNIPLDVIQILLNLAEYMEHNDKNLPIAISSLSLYAINCRAYAKALHYKELEVIQDPSPQAIEELIRINNSLQQPDVSVGILLHASTVHNLALKEEWYVELERWDDALAAFERRELENPGDFDNVLGRMKCLHALGEWESLGDLAQMNWNKATTEYKRKMAPLAAAAAWGLAQWETMDSYITALKHDSPDRAWFRSILLIHQGQFPKAKSQISKARDLLDNELRTLVGESYNRAYDAVVRIQMLSELEEVISYKDALVVGDVERRQVIQKTWMKRLSGCKKDVDVWQRILKVRALVLTPRENTEMWVKYANLCRKSGRLGLAEKTLNSLLGEAGPVMSGPPLVIYSHLKYTWATGAKQETLAFLREFTAKLSQDMEQYKIAEARAGPVPDPSLVGRLSEYTKLLARCYFKLGEWQMASQEHWGSDAAPEILQSYLFATNFDRNWYKAWHAWALANSELVTHFVRSQDNDTVPENILHNHLIPSVQGFFRAIALSSGSSLQDTLRLLTLWFRYGDAEIVFNAIMEGTREISVDTWLEVIPQLIARIHTPSSNIRKLIQHVLTDVGKSHPQALVYPLTVASKYPSVSRRRAALLIMDKMRDHSAKLVEQALMVSQELIRVAILWQEMWYQGLEEASRLFYGDHNVEAMFAVLEPLHELIEKGPETNKEISFAQTFGRDLHEAHQSCKRYREFNQINDLHHAWDLYYQIFKKINKMLPALTVVDLEYTSPKLLAAKNLDLAVPGSYSPSKPVVCIASFAPTLDVFASKQRPRKLKLTGSDGRDYSFLLKGHEDLRQDERVMQLFGLVNMLLVADPECFKRHLTIVKYPVIPLSPNSGLLGWVDNTDTLHVLIKDYRDSRKILLNIEHRLILQMAPDFDHLCLLQKLEVFEYALDNTTGQDFYRILWLKSRNSETWLDRRSNYCRTLAVMSMVGHILGLGDRHPSNLLMDRGNGKIVHVDFGDCFEVAMHREKHPEKIPFRLTRMLTSAMEVSGVEGTFKLTSFHTMRVLRDNKESIIAVLEAFVHDPLINWRLVQGGRQVDGGGQGGANGRRPQGAETNIYDEDAVEQINTRAVQVVDRVTQKLTGRDFKPTVVLNVEDQVEKLIYQATSLENLSQCFIGWCPFW